jgi:hypothetical protein
VIGSFFPALAARDRVKKIFFSHEPELRRKTGFELVRIMATTFILLLKAFPREVSSFFIKLPF